MKRTLILAIDYGQHWPLSDIMSSAPRPDWEALLTRELHDRLVGWAAFFNEYYDWETGIFGSEERRAWFYSEARGLLAALREQAGAEYDFELRLWQ